jgi:hypothetical protein
MQGSPLTRVGSGLSMNVISPDGITVLVAETA